VRGGRSFLRESDCVLMSEGRAAVFACAVQGREEFAKNALDVDVHPSMSAPRPGRTPPHAADRN
jgi:hypothetical protein